MGPHLSRQPNGYVVKWHARSHGEVTKGCADVAPMGGGAEPDPRDQDTCGVLPTRGVSVKNPGVKRIPF